MNNEEKIAQLQGDIKALQEKLEAERKENTPRRWWLFALTLYVIYLSSKL